MGHDGGVLDEGLDAAERLGEREEPHALEEVAGLGEAALEEDGDHAAEARHLPLRDVVLRVGGEARVDDALDAVVRFEELGDARGGGVVALHAEGEGLGAAEGEVGVEGGEDAADGVLEEADAARELSVVDNKESADDVGVAGDVLGDGVHHHVEAVLEGALVDGGAEGVVAAEEGAGALLFGELGDAGEVGDLEGGVGGRLDPDHFGVGGEGVGEGVVVGEVGVGDVEVLGALADAGEEAVGAAVEVVHGDDAVAGVEELEGGPDGGHAGGEGEAALGGVVPLGEGGALEAGDESLEGVAGGVVGAGVLEALVDARRFLGVGGGGEDGWHDGAGDGLGRLVGVDAAGGGAHLARVEVGHGVGSGALVPGRISRGYSARRARLMSM